MAEGGQGSEDYRHLFRFEGVVAEADLSVNVCENFNRYVFGDEHIQLDADTVHVKGPVALKRGDRIRDAGQYERTTSGEEGVSIGAAYHETVHGSVHQLAALGAEAIVGGAYVNTIAGPYMRVAMWCDYMAWGGWAEIDLLRMELALLMIRSHFAYAHAALARITSASRLIDDFFMRKEDFGVLLNSGVTYTDIGAPGGGIDNEA